MTFNWNPSSLALLVVVLLAPAARGAVSATPDFQRDVRPILSRYCFHCHGPDDKSRKAKLRLDERDGAIKELKSGETAVVPGKPDASELVRRILSTDADEVMPPPETKHVLTDAQKQTLKAWIASGANYTPHWAFQKPVRPTVPEVRSQDSGVRIQNPIDNFIVAKLREVGLKQSPPADDYTLVRRLYLDLIGLPPTPEQADEFIQAAKANRQQAIENLVNQLLASPHYGERWARKWLDLARYADTNGYEKDRDRSIWPWRDWVINALNADLPFDQFTIKQIAGDLLPNATRDDLIATGFHRNTMLNEEGGIDPLEFRFYAMVDRVAVTGTTWLGLTTQCAQCHTHKFDPITHREYYSLMALLNNADEPELDLPTPDVLARRAETEVKIEKLTAALADRWPVETLRWEVAKPAKVTSSDGIAPQIANGSVVSFTNDAPDAVIYTIELDSVATNITLLQLEALPNPALPKQGPGRSPSGNFVLSEITVTAQPKDGSAPAQSVKLVKAEADFAQEKFPVANAIDGNAKTGWAIANPGKEMNVRRVAKFHLEQPTGFAGGTRFVVTLEHSQGKKLALGSFRLSLGHEVGSELPVVQRREQEFATEYSKWLTTERARTVEWQVLKPTAMKANLALLTLQPDLSVFATGDQSKSDTYSLKFRVPAGVTAFRLEAIPDDRLPEHGPGAVYYEGPRGDFFLSEFSVNVSGQPVKFSAGTDSYGKAGIGRGTARAANCIDGDQQSGWSINGGQGRRHVAVFSLSEPLAAAGEIDLNMLFEKHYAAPLGRFRISVTTDKRAVEANDFSEEIEALLLKPESQLSATDQAALRRQFTLVAPQLATARQEIEKLRKQLPEIPTTLVMRERPPQNPRATFIHNRGEFLQPTDKVEPGVIAALHPLPSDAPKDRLSLARWLVAQENPLTARVVVNRAWQAFFGRGLVETLADLGLQGEMPSHPELLDWLATEFMRDGWSQKRLHKLIVLSATYQQSATVTPELLERDSGNVLLARAPRFRLEAEVIRDAVLQSSGLLTPKIGGPSVYPPQPASVTSEGVYAARGWPESTGPDRYRRGLYTFAKRSTPFAMFNTFDAPSGEACQARREVSNTPLQALTLMNDIVFTEAAQTLGNQLSGASGTVEEKISGLFRRILTRAPSKDELGRLVKFYEAQLARFTAKELDAKVVAGSGDGDMNARAAWTVVARSLFNLDETVTKG